MNIEEMRAEREALRDEIIRLGELAEPTDEDVTAHENAVTRFDDLDGKIGAAEERAARAEQLRQARPEPVAQAARVEAPQIVPQKRDTYDVLHDRGAAPGEVRDAALRELERASKMPTSSRKPQWEQVEGMIRTRPSLARHAAAFGTEQYEDAFYAMIRAGEATWAGLSPEQRDVMSRAAVAVGTATQGGALVPTHLDPTVMLSNDGTINPFRRVSRVESLVGDGETWYGITSAGITASWDAELAEVSDDSPSFANPSVPVYKGQAFAMASDEAVESIANLPADLLRMFADARDRLEAAAFATGSGSAQPTGIFTALDANTNVEIEVTTQGSLGAVDIYTAHDSVPARFRQNATWCMSRSLISDIRQIGHREQLPRVHRGLHRGGHRAAAREGYRRVRGCP